MINWRKNAINGLMATGIYTILIGLFSTLNIRKLWGFYIGWMIGSCAIDYIKGRRR